MSRTRAATQRVARKPPAPVPAKRAFVSDGVRLSLPLAAGVLAVVCASAYWNSFRAGFLLDNQSIVLQDIRLRAIDWQSLRSIFTFNYWWPTFESDLFRPLTTLTYWINYSVLGNGQDPAGYHAVNLLLHWANAVLAFALVREVARRSWPALIAAAVFAAHPLTVESVTNVVGRADLLAGMSTLGGLWLYLRFLGETGRQARRDEQVRPLRTRLLLAGLAATYLAGVFCKESAVVLPAMIVLHDVAFPPVEGPTRLAALRGSAMRVFPAYVSLLPGAAALVLARWAMFHSSPIFAQNGADNPIAIAGFWTGLMTAVKVAGYYLALFLWPVTLSCDYSCNQITLFGWTLASGQDLHAWIAIAVFAGLLAVAGVTWRRDRAVAFFLGLAAIAFAPVANVFFPIGTIMAERLMYGPLVGLAAALVLGLAAGGERLLATRPANARRTWTFAARAAGLGVVIALAARTIARNEDWTSAFRLWSAAVEATPNNYKAYRALAAQIMESDPSGGRVDEALDTALRGVRILEQTPLPLAHLPAGLYADVGWYYTRKAEALTAGGQQDAAHPVLARALERLQQAVRIDREMNRQGRAQLLKRGLGAGEIHDVGHPVIYRNLGSAYLLAGEPLQAIDAFTYLQHIQPADYDSHFERGVAEATAAQLEQKQGHEELAEQHLERAAIDLIAATILNPDHEMSWQVLRGVYQHIAPVPPAVIEIGRHTLNVQNPVVARHLQQACVQLVRQLFEAGRRDEAEMWRRRMIKDFRVPETVLLQIPGS